MHNIFSLIFLFLFGSIPYTAIELGKKNFTLKNAIEQIFNDLASSNSKITILLAPACSSFDQFNNFEERGEKFKEMIFNKIN